MLKTGGVYLQSSSSWLLVSSSCLSRKLKLIVLDILVIAPFRIPLPRFFSVLLSKLSPRLWNDHDRRLHFPVNFVSAPVFGVFFLWAAQCIDGTIVRNGIVGVEGIKPLDIMALFISLVGLLFSVV